MFVPKGLILSRQQAIIWTNDGIVCWRIYASLGLNELTRPLKCFADGSFGWLWSLIAIGSLWHWQYQAITWTNDDQDLWYHMVELDHIDLNIYMYIYIFVAIIFARFLTHLSLVLHICVSEIGQHWFS